MKYTLEETYIINVEKSQSTVGEIPPSYERNSLRIVGEEHMAREVRDLRNKKLIVDVFQTGRTLRHLTDTRLTRIISRYPPKKNP